MPGAFFVVVILALAKSLLVKYTDACQPEPIPRHRERTVLWHMQPRYLVDSPEGDHHQVDTVATVISYDTAANTGGRQGKEAQDKAGRKWLCDRPRKRERNGKFIVLQSHTATCSAS